MEPSAPLGPSLQQEADRLAEAYVGSSKNVGLAVGLITGDDCRWLAYGETARGSSQTPDANTMFEIGSITKVFTAALLAEMVGRGEVRLDQPVAELLPPEVRVPSYRGAPITLAHLAEHTSALPRLPGNFWPTVTDEANPYRDYQPSHLHEYLTRATIGFPPGTGESYSNLGAGLLGHALALRAGKPFEELLAERILRPLGLVDTAITLSDDQAARLAPGHTAKGEPTANWDIPTLAGAGALRSSIAEMLSFLRANLNPPDTSAGAALRTCQAPRPMAWRGRIGIGVLHGVGLAAAALLITWLAPPSPGSKWLMVLAYLPVLVAMTWKGFWSGVWAAAAMAIGGLMLWSSWSAWGPVVISLLCFLVGAGGASGYLPPRSRVRLGWQENALRPGGTALWHNGMTGGYSSFIGFTPGSQVGVAVLSNSANSVDAIGMGLLKSIHKANSF